MNLYLLAQAVDSSSSHWTHRVLQPEVMPFFVAIVAVIGGIGYAITKAVIRHRERMAMLEHGIDPDANNRT